MSFGLFKTVLGLQRVCNELFHTLALQTRDRHLRRESIAESLIFLALLSLAFQVNWEFSDLSKAKVMRYVAILRFFEWILEFCTQFLAKEGIYSYP
ncbi:hypothetical protein [Lusitaniella coriacea]|uniref:hypothetical protein n=1 Tax=Lusitaniella coriacea TaxID=1983105 RepID=UPI003CF21734